jgi:endonuclease-3
MNNTELPSKHQESRNGWEDSPGSASVPLACGQDARAPRSLFSVQKPNQYNAAIHQVVATLQDAMEAYPRPLVDGMAAEQQSPFRVLVATILSLRTKDTLTAQVAPQLFAIAATPTAMLEMSEEELASQIYPVGFYRNKARTIRKICTILIEQHGGGVPDTLPALLALPGVGRKTANLVLTRGFGLPGICVDTHVHRICNRWGYVQTKTPDQTEFALREKLPEQYWIAINGLLVTLGQHICHPTSPRCSQCPVAAWCERVGVARSR